MFKIPFFIIGIILTYAEAFSQSCSHLEGGAKPEKGSLGYQFRKSGNYCEGIITNIDSANELFEVISYTIGPITYYLSKEEVISIHNINNEQINIQGKNYDMAIHYQLDMQCNPEEIKELYVKEVLYNSQIYKERLGIFGYTGDFSLKTYYPIRLKSKLQNSKESNDLYLSIKISNMIKILRYQILGIDNKSNNTDIIKVEINSLKNKILNINKLSYLKKGKYIIKFDYGVYDNFNKTKQIIVKI